MVTKICVGNNVGDVYYDAKFYPNRFRSFGSAHVWFRAPRHKVTRLFFGGEGGFLRKATAETRAPIYFDANYVKYHVTHGFHLPRCGVPKVFKGSLGKRALMFFCKCIDMFFSVFYQIPVWSVCKCVDLHKNSYKLMYAVQSAFNKSHVGCPWDQLMVKMKYNGLNPAPMDNRRKSWSLYPQLLHTKS